MKRYLIATLIFFFSVAVFPAHAAFWDGWFKKNQPVSVEKEIAVVDKENVERRIGILKEIAAGIYAGPKNIAMSFSESELKQVVLPFANEKIKRNPRAPSFSLNDVFLSDGRVEARVSITKPFRGNLAVQIVPSVQNGGLKIGINEIKFGWLKISRQLIYKMMEANKIKPEKLIQKTPNFSISEIAIENKTITIRGEYLK